MKSGLFQIVKKWFVALKSIEFDIVNVVFAVLKNKLPIEFLYGCFIHEFCFSEAMPRSYKKVKTESYDKKDLELAILLI